MSQWKFYTQQDPLLRGPVLIFGKRHDNGSLDLVTGLTFKQIRVDEAVPRGATPFDDLSEDVEGFLRAAMNCAWELGLRPDGFNDTRESMKATKAHLDDMRALAFHKIGAPKP